MVLILQVFIFKISFIEKRKKDAGGHPFGKYKNINGANFIHAFSLQEGGAKRKSHFAAQSCKKKRRIGDFAALKRRAKTLPQELGRYVRSYNTRTRRTPQMARICAVTVSAGFGEMSRTV